MHHVSVQKVSPRVPSFKKEMQVRGWGGRKKSRPKNESWLILSELEASAPEPEHEGLSLPVPESAVKCPVEETQPRESQCDQHSHVSNEWVGGRGGGTLFIF